MSESSLGKAGVCLVAGGLVDVVKRAIVGSSPRAGQPTDWLFMGLTGGVHGPGCNGCLLRHRLALQTKVLTIRRSLPRAPSHPIGALSSSGHLSFLNIGTEPK
ncbi:MAG TPA: hypothetical protein VK502_03730 [Candidatus Saccharimonadales bacterium]|nr:hypothetical protein [Candidatus Saccharimonadales bacterium]